MQICTYALYGMRHVGRDGIDWNGLPDGVATYKKREAAWLNEMDRQTLLSIETESLDGQCQMKQSYMGSAQIW